MELEATELFPDRVWAKASRVERKLLEHTRAFIGDEQVLRMFRGQTVLSPVVLPVIGQLPFIAQPRAVIVTEKSIVTVRQSAWSQSMVVGLVSRHLRGSVPVEVSPWALKIGDDNKIFALFTTLGDMKQVARLAARAVV